MVLFGHFVAADFFSSAFDDGGFSRSGVLNAGLSISDFVHVDPTDADFIGETLCDGGLIGVNVAKSHSGLTSATCSVGVEAYGEGGDLFEFVRGRHAEKSANRSSVWCFLLEKAWLGDGVWPAAVAIKTAWASSLSLMNTLIPLGRSITTGAMAAAVLNTELGHKVWSQRKA